MYGHNQQMINQQNSYNHQQVPYQVPSIPAPEHNQHYPSPQQFPQPKYLVNGPVQGQSYSQSSNSQMMNNNVTNSNANQYVSVSGNKNKALIQPPALKVEEQIDLSQHAYQRPPMTISNNMHSEFDGYHPQQDEQNWANEAEIASMFWQQRCMTMLERFQWYYERYQIIRQQYLSLSDQMQKMDSQEEWHHFQQHHNELHQKIEQMQQELTAVLGQNEQLLQQKHNQDNQSVWQQRYQQLLGNFKSLQEQMANMQPNNNNSQIAEQYHQLEQHYAELEYQYNEMYNEYQQYRVSGGGDLEQKLSAYMQQIQNYKGKLNELHGENVQLQNMLVQLQQQNNMIKQQNFNSETDKKKYQDLLDQVYQKQQQIKSLQQQFKLKNRATSNISNYQNIIQQKNAEISQLQKIIEKKNVELKDNRSDHLIILQETKNKLKDQHQKEKLNLLKNIKELEKQVEGFKKQNSKFSDLSHKIQNLEKKLAYANKQVQNLNENIRRKNQQLIQLRSLTYQIDKLKEAQSQFSKIVDEKDRLTEYIRKKNQEIESLVGQNQRLSQINQEMNNRRQQFNSKNLRTEIQDLNQTIQHLKSELNRQKSLVSSKHDYSIKLEQQLKQTKQKLVMLNQVYEMESQNWKAKQIKISSKNNDYDQKIKNLDYQFNIQLKDTLERQITVLRKQNVQKQTMVRKYEQNQLLLLSKISVFEKQQGQFDKQIKLIKQKNREYELSLNNINKMYNELSQIYKIKQEQTNSLLNKLNSLVHSESKLRNELEQHNNHLRTKNKTIQELQYHLKVNLGKVQQANRLAAQNSKLHLIIGSLERQNSEKLQISKIKGLSAVNSKSSLDKQDSHNLVNILNQQNQHLKEEINKLLQRYAQIPSQETPKLSKSKVIPQNLNRRLNQFNNRLQITIKGTNSGLKASQSQKSLYLWQQQRAKLINYYQSEIKSLKQQLQVKKFGHSQVSNVSNQSAAVTNNAKKIAFSKFGSQTQKEQLQFLRQKNKQYEQRIGLLLKVNQQLKQKIQSILHIKQSNSTLQYYKKQLQKSQQDYQSLNSKYKKLLEQNRQNKLQLTTKNSKLSQQFEFKLIELQMVNQQQQRKISMLQSQKLTTDNEKATLIHNMNVYNISGHNQNQNQNYNLQEKEAARPYNSAINRSSYVQQSYGNKAINEVRNPRNSPKNIQLPSKYDNIHNQFGSILNNAHLTSEDISPSNIKSVQSRIKYGKKY